jgi:hypothetical protein
VSEVSPADVTAGPALVGPNGHVVAGRHLDERRRHLRSTRVGMKASPTSMRFDALLPFESWTLLGSRIGVHANASSWWLGDWLLFGRMKYGRRYKEAVERTGLDYQTLRNYAVVARRFDPSRRREDLTFQHHAEVTSLSDDEQDSWLARAADGGWSKQELRRRISASRGSASAVTLRIAVDAEREQRWRSAADRSRCSLELWISRVVDEACESCS